MQVREDTRCFNCGSYDHSLKNCSKEKDIGAITNARKQHQAKKNINSRPRVPTRYFQDSPAGKYDGLKQGSLSTETRQLLGIGVCLSLTMNERDYHRSICNIFAGEYFITKKLALGLYIH